MDFNLNHSGEMIEDLLGNDREMTLHLKEAMKQDAKARFRLTALIGGLLGVIGISFLFVAFIPGIITLWLMGMAVGCFVAAVLGILFSMPVTDSVSVHLKVIDYVDNVIKSNEKKDRNLMSDREEDDMIELSSDPVPEEEDEEEDDDDEEEESKEGAYRTREDHP